MEYGFYGSEWDSSDPVTYEEVRNYILATKLQQQSVGYYVVQQDDTMPYIPVRPATATVGMPVTTAVSYLKTSCIAFEPAQPAHHLVVLIQNRKVYVC